jgi:3-hydroxymyristoyl/3-hydroxydecanoyl-(acyl carrier protein) dehydratase
MNWSVYLTDKAKDNKLTKIWPQLLETHFSQEEDSVELSFFVPKDLDYFNGHFPDTPILAGVVQLHWAVEYAKEQFLLVDQIVKNIEVLKFKGVIVPEQNLQLTLTKKSAEKVIFSYFSDKGQHASGRIVFEPTF